MANTLTALAEIKRAGLEKKALRDPESSNRINAAGEYLEQFVKRAFSSSFSLTPDKAAERQKRLFSWMGNQNNPPDIILKGGDAVEVKKLASKKGSHIALNSSIPKQKIFKLDKKLTVACRNCEPKWSSKDLLYAVGNMPDGLNISRLFFVYGDCYAAGSEVYTRISDKVSSSVKGSGVDLSDTVELARVNRVDPLGRTYFRVRGMWGIRVPFHCFGQAIPSKLIGNKVFALMKSKKYSSFPAKDRRRIEKMRGVSVVNMPIPNPDNAAKKIMAKLITF